MVSICIKIALKNGIILKKNNIFEKINHVDQFVFDKTGTLISNFEKVHQFRLKSFDQNLIFNLLVSLEVPF